jgi:hypothetical protein
MPHSRGWGKRRDERTPDATPIGEIVDGLLTEHLFARGMEVGRLASMWEQVVGPRLAAETSPHSLEHGVLVVSATSGPWGAQAKFLNEEIRRRANEALGSADIRSVRIVVRNTR